MAYSVTQVQNRKSSDKYREYVCDTAADIAKLPTSTTPGEPQEGRIGTDAVCTIGSVATVISPYSTYILGHDDQWHEVVAQSGSGSSSDLQDLVNVIKGKSAYEIWEAKPENNGQSEDAFLASLKGEPGTPGKDGAAGKDGAPGAAGVPGEPGPKGDQGKSVTKIALTKNAAGEIISGTVTFSDETEGEIAITTVESE